MANEEHDALLANANGGDFFQSLVARARIEEILKTGDAPKEVLWAYERAAAFWGYQHSDKGCEGAHRPGSQN